MHTIKGVLFDMDGLMIDTEKWLQKYYVQAAQELGFPMKPEHVLEIRSLPAEYAIPKLKKLVCEDFDYHAVKNLRKLYMSQHIEKYGIKKKKGLDELLSYIKASGLKCSVATATPPDRTRQYLSQLNILEYFDQIVCASMVKHGKPQPDIYIEATKRLSLKPQQCIALEDSPNGVLSAYRAGCITVMVPDLTQPDEETARIIYKKANDLSQVIDIIKNINSKSDTY